MAILGFVSYFSGGSQESCLTVGIPGGYCAILFDEEDCDSGSSLLKIKDGGEGRLSKWSPFPSSTLERNDLESLIVQSHCKLELWDDDDGIDKGEKPDLVIDNTYFTTAKYLNSFHSIDELSHLDEKISAFRCNCKQPDITVKYWEKEIPKKQFSSSDLLSTFQLLDQDNDKRLTSEEFVLFGFKKDLADTMLQVSDIDGNGSLSFIEFTVLMEVLKNVHDVNHGHSH